MPRIRNPILPGFNPDPSILRVGPNYFIATSTFEWYPGVQIHHSLDLANWTLVSRPLCHHPSKYQTTTSSAPHNEKPYLDMRGEPDSCGVWAPCLSYSDKKFWLVYTDVRRKDGSFKDTVNWISCLDDPKGDGSSLLLSSSPSSSSSSSGNGNQWGTPVYVGQNSGFDPSLFHDDSNDGKKYFVSMLQDHRARGRGKAGRSFAGIIMQEFDPKEMKLVGERRNVFRGTALDLVEGPHLYWKDGYYYLLTAEGGTGYGHACTIARSKGKIWGPYDEDTKEEPLLSSKWDGGAVLQRAGHGSLVDTYVEGDDKEKKEKKWFLVHLMGRILKGTEEKDDRGNEGKVKGRCVLGRETSIQEVEWREDGWCYLKKEEEEEEEGQDSSSSFVPSEQVQVLGSRDEVAYWAERRYRFPCSPDEVHSPPLADPSVRGLHRDFQWLRTPEPERIFRVEDEKLVLIGRESPGSWIEQSLVARRQTHFSYDAETVLGAGYSPEDERQFAGLVAYYCRYNFFYLAVSGTTGLPADKGGFVGRREIQILTSEASWPEGKLHEPTPPPVALPDGYMGRVKLGLTVRGKEGKFFYALEKQQGGEGVWGDVQQVGDSWDASILSDECGGHQAHGSFTGTFVGVACSDLNGMAMEAGFEEFVYRPVKDA